MKRVYFNDLDALRFFGFFFVFLAHCFIYEHHLLMSHGMEGFTFFLIRIGHNVLSMFFVLSGFLINFLLTEELKANKKINLLKYYQRRSLRILPLYFLLLIFLFYIYPTFSERVFHEKMTVEVTQWKYFAFVNNFDLIDKGANIPSLVILWSIAIEMQFYLVWPIIFLLFKKNILFPLITALVISIFFRAFNYSYPDNLHFHTLSCLSDLSIGGILAYVYSHHKTRVLHLVNKVEKSHLYVFYSLFAAYLIFFAGANYDNIATAIIDKLITGLGFAFILAEQITSSNSILKLRNYSWLKKLGSISYGLYCFHYLAIAIIFTIMGRFKVTNSIPIFAINIILSLLLTIVISLISFKFYESYFLKLKKY